MTAESQTISLRYDEPDIAKNSEEGLHLVLPCDGNRDALSAELSLEDSSLLRDSLLVMTDILRQDARFKKSDRSDYLAYLLKQGRNATKELWEAQKAYIESQYEAAESSEGPPDPLLTITKERLDLEVFSADESAYARLSLKHGEAWTASKIKEGCSHIDLAALAGNIGKLRGYRNTRISVGQSKGSGKSNERSVDVPLRWIRALGQMQAASTLPQTTFELAPIDLYNLLFTLRSQRAKRSPRALRYELMPGQAPKLVLEPWDLAIESQGPVYDGAPAIVRTWGRKRLSVLARILPHVKSMSVHLVGPGLPAFYEFDLGPATLSLALSGWTDSGWAGISTFDLFGESPPKAVLDNVAKAISAKGETAAELSEKLGMNPAEVKGAILAHMRNGNIVHHIPSGRFIRRSLLAVAVDPQLLLFRDEREEAAHRLLATPDSVKIVSLHDLGNEGVRIEGEVSDPQAHRSYQSSFTIDREGRTIGAKCTSPQFRRAGLREGPSVPMIALRLLYARQRVELEEARKTAKGRKKIKAETRVLIKRSKSEVTMMRISLDHKRVVVRWGNPAKKMRMSQQCFSELDSARDDYFQRLADCESKGFVDASAAEAF